MVKNIRGNPILGGSRVMITSGKLKGKKGYVYQIMGNDEIRVTKKPRTGLLGWFKSSELLVTTKRSKRKH